MLRIKKTQSQLVKNLLKDIVQTEKNIRKSKTLSEYDKENTLYFLSAIKTLGNIERKKWTKCPEIDDTDVLCDKIKFYNREYKNYNSYYSQFKQIDDVSLKDYKSQLNRLVKHLRFKIRELKSNLVLVQL